MASRVSLAGFDGGSRKEPTPRGETVGDRGWNSSQARLRAAASAAAIWIVLRRGAETQQIFAQVLAASRVFLPS